MKQLINQFNQARDYLVSIIPIRVETFLVAMANPLVQHTLIRETTNIIEKELLDLFPTIKEEQLPQFRFRIHQEFHEVEVGVQFYFNTQNGLTYLGSTDIGTEVFDLYFRESYDPNMDFRVVARYGSSNDDYISGSKTAEAEYYLGQETPLSYAYALALEDGYIE